MRVFYGAGPSALLVAGLAGLGACSEAPQRASTSPAEVILAAFEHAELVCLGEIHGSAEDAALRRAVVAHPAFPDRVDQILVEFGNPLHQDLLDRLVLQGEHMPRSRLAPVWQDAGFGLVWQMPIYEDFLRQVAAVNRKLEASRRIRVLGASTPIDWTSVRSPEDLRPFLDRQGVFARTVRAQALKRRRRTLAIFGAGHCERSGRGFPAALGEDERRRVWSLLPLQGEVGLAAGHAMFGTPEVPRVIPVDSEIARRPAGMLFFEGHAFSGARIGDLADGIVDHARSPQPVEFPTEEELEPPLRQELRRRADLWERARQLEPQP